MKSSLFIIVAFSSLLFSCTSSEYVSLKTPQLSGEEIDIYLTSDIPEKPYERLGYIETSGWIFTTNKRLLIGLQKKAGKVGADALINVEFGYIPHISTGIPVVTGVAVKWK
ncbi:MAG: hypothetical protein WEC59_06630 [Salibacteraceae bacterium]